VTTLSEQLLARIDRARDPLVERVLETVLENTFTGIVGEAESGKTYTLRRALRLMGADGWRFVELDLDGAYSANQLAWTWARQMARAVMDGVAFSHMTSLSPSMWPSSTRGEFANLPRRIGAEATRLAQAPHPDGTVGSAKQLTALARATANLAREGGRIVLVVDHLEAPETTRARTPDARELLWMIRAAGQHVPDLHVVASCRPVAQDLAADTDAAYHLDGRWLTVGPLTVEGLPDELGHEEAATVIGATGGHPPATHELIVEMLTGEPSRATPNRPGVALQTAIGRLAARHASLAGRYLQHARSLHRLGGHLLQVTARGEGPYSGSPNIDPSQIAEAMKRLDLAGLVAKRDRASTEWVIADPRVGWALGQQPAWIIPTPARVTSDARMMLTTPHHRGSEHLDLNAGVAPWLETFDAGERLLLDRLAAGATNGQIANDLGISRATVTRQLRRLYDKVGASGRREIVQQLRALADSRD
jgi:DNA-binding CsgD family transcriptional regulator